MSSGPMAGTSRSRCSRQTRPPQPKGTSTIPLSPTNTFSTGSLRGSDLPASGHAGGGGSHIHNHLQRRFLQSILQHAQNFGQLVELLVVELGIYELVQGFLLRGESGKVLVGLVGQR